MDRYQEQPFGFADDLYLEQHFADDLYLEQCFADDFHLEQHFADDLYLEQHFADHDGLGYFEQHSDLDHLCWQCPVLVQTLNEKNGESNTKKKK